MTAPDASAFMREIVLRTDKAIALANLRVRDEQIGGRRNRYQLLATNLAKYKSSLLEGRLPAPGSGIGWGAGRAISDWGLDDDEMSVAVEAAEALYRDGR